MKTISNNKYILKIIADLGLIELSPIFVFIIINKYFDFFQAALALAIVTLATLLLSKKINKRLPYFALFSGIITILTAMLSFIFKNADILIIEDSFFSLIFASLLFQSIKRKTYILKKFFGHIFLIEDNSWEVLQKRWMLFFLLSFLANEYFRIFQSPDVWIEYKKIFIIIFIIFGTYQFRISAKGRLKGSNKFGIKNS